ncbi:MAG: GGDEF domain-containing protein [Trueperaceae bacterium]|nr:GGDEF domain-containing protein [Trueperaceae bacterium]
MTMRAPPDAGRDEPNAVKRQSYLWILGAITLGMAALALLTPDAAPMVHALIGHYAWVLTVYVALLFVLLWRVPSALRYVELAVYWTMFPIFLVNLAMGLQVAADAAEQERLLYSFTVRSPIVIVWSFLTFGARRGLAVASAFVVATVAVFTTVTGTGATTTQEVRISFAIFVGSTIVFVGALYTFARLLERQITARASAEAAAEYALKDVLTGLPNRVALEARFDHSRASLRRTGGMLAVCFVDLDDFKRINDTYGHEVGDDVLRRFSERIHGTVRATDTVARMGGDEFVVLAAVADEAQAGVLAERLATANAAPYELRPPLAHAPATVPAPPNAYPEVVLGASLGVALYPRDGDDIQALLRSADAAMYGVKRRSKSGASVPAVPAVPAVEVRTAAHDPAPRSTSMPAPPPGD